jgi:hypothetical protein
MAICAMVNNLHCAEIEGLMRLKDLELVVQDLCSLF